MPDIETVQLADISSVDSDLNEDNPEGQNISPENKSEEEAELSVDVQTNMNMPADNTMLATDVASSETLLLSAADDDDASEEDDDTEDIDPDNIVLEGPAKMKRGKKVRYPSSLGSWSTFKYTVDGKQAYCLESEKTSPKGGSFAQDIIDINPNLTKALY